MTTMRGVKFSCAQGRPPGDWQFPGANSYLIHRVVHGAKVEHWVEQQRGFFWFHVEPPCVRKKATNSQVGAAEQKWNTEWNYGWGFSRTPCVEYWTTLCAKDSQCTLLAWNKVEHGGTKGMRFQCLPCSMWKHPVNLFCCCLCYHPFFSLPLFSPPFLTLPSLLGWWREGARKQQQLCKQIARKRHHCYSSY